MTFPVIYIMGVSGSGKTTIGKKLSERTGIPFFDGDDFHPAANKEKMKAGLPLNDDDRKEWLLSINKLVATQSYTSGAIIACSALKEKYRELLSQGINSIHWVFLQGDYALISERMKARKDHYMPASLLQSQFDILETPGNAMVIAINTDPEEIVKKIVDELSL